MDNQPILTIAYSVLADCLEGMELPDPQDRVEILVLIQGADVRTPPFQQRPDVRCLFLDSMGVARSRSEALRHGRGAYLLFADDDITLCWQGIFNTVERFDQHPDLVMILGQSANSDGSLRKAEITEMRPMTPYNCARAATYEMMVRVSAVRDFAVAFDPDFGAGVPNYLGDEYIFLTDLLRVGARGVLVPDVYAIHGETSSGMRKETTESLRVRRKVFQRVFGPRWPLIWGVFLLRRPGKLLQAILPK